VKTARCLCKLRYVPKFTAASRSPSCNRTAFLSGLLLIDNYYDRLTDRSCSFVVSSAMICRVMSLGCHGKAVMKLTNQSMCGQFMTGTWWSRDIAHPAVYLLQQLCHVNLAAALSCMKPAMVANQISHCHLVKRNSPTHSGSYNWWVTQNVLSSLLTTHDVPMPPAGIGIKGLRNSLRESYIIIHMHTITLPIVEIVDKTMHNLHNLSFSCPSAL